MPQSASPSFLPQPLNRKASGWPWEAGPLPPASPGQWPKISIVTPSFNQGEFLEETIRSVLLQGYPNLEYLVIDGGSTDNSVEIIRHYAGFLDFWVSEPDHGQSHAINKGLRRATGEIAGWLNSDDYFLPGALAEVAAMHRLKPAAIAWAGVVLEKNLAGQTTHTHRPKPGDQAAFADWGVAAYISQPGCLFSREAYLQAGGIDERLHNVLDVEFWMRLAALGEFAVSDRLLAVSRGYPDAKTYRDLVIREAEHIHVCLMHGQREVAKTRLDRYVTEHIQRHIRENAAKIAMEHLLAAPRSKFFGMLGMAVLRRISRHLKRRMPFLRRFF